MNPQPSFYQTPHELEDPYRSDRVLRSYLARIFSAHSQQHTQLTDKLIALSAIIC